ncbi:MAG: alginate export family protein [Candidatus Omnitrophica bacterium]|nr:alginate export family protein [Candidatus Omnitrophota bacterium]
MKNKKSFYKQLNSRSIFFLFVICSLFLLFAFSSYALTQNQEKRIEEDTRKALESTETEILSQTDEFVYDFGGWVDFRYTDYTDDDNNSSVTDYYDYTYMWDTRLWFKAALRTSGSEQFSNEHTFYMRFKDQHIYRRPDDTAGGADHDGPHLEYIYGTLDYDPVWIDIGRKYYSIGQGIAYSNVNDGFAVRYLPGNWGVKAMAVRTLPYEDNIDSSVPGYDKKSERYFFGIEPDYRGISGHRFYGYSLYQMDETNEDPEDVAQDYGYDSLYFGLGAEGELLEGLTYLTEVIYEMGKSYTSVSNERSDIEAWACDVEIRYEADIYSRPGISGQFACASGDPDRVDVTNTIDGNLTGKDKNFMYFGYLPTGYALAPRFSNIMFYRAGIDLFPLEKWKFFRDLNVSAEFFRFYKAESQGGISDYEASANSCDIGYEIDLTIKWNILSDLQLLVEYGYFFPGEAYTSPDNDEDIYLSVSLSFSF